MPSAFEKRAFVLTKSTGLFRSFKKIISIKMKLNLDGILDPLTFALPIKKRVFSKEKISGKKEKNLVYIIKAHTFALPNKNGVKVKPKVL